MLANVAVELLSLKTTGTTRNVDCYFSLVFFPFSFTYGTRFSVQVLYFHVLPLCLLEHTHYPVKSRTAIQSITPSLLMRRTCLRLLRYFGKPEAKLMQSIKSGNGEYYVDQVDRQINFIRRSTLTLNAFHSSLTSSYNETALAAATKATNRMRIFILFRIFLYREALYTFYCPLNSCGM